MRLRFRYGYKTALVYLAVFAGMILLNFTMRSFEPFSLPLFAAALVCGLHPLALAGMYILAGGLSLLAGAEAFYVFLMQGAFLGGVFFAYERAGRSMRAEFALWCAVALLPFLWRFGGYVYADYIRGALVAAAIFLLCLLFLGAGRCLLLHAGRRKLPPEELIFLAAGAAAVGVGLYNCLGESFYQAVALFLLLLSCALLRNASAVFCALVLGIAPAVCRSVSAMTPDLYPIAAFCLCAAAALLLLRSGKLPCALGAFFADVLLRTLSCLADAGMAGLTQAQFYLTLVVPLVPCLLFALLPESLLRRGARMIRLYGERRLTRTSIDKNRAEVGERLFEMSAAFREIENAFYTFAAEQSFTGAGELLAGQVRAEACAICEKLASCDVKTEGGLQKLVDVGCEKGKVSLIDLPSALSAECPNPAGLLFSLNRVLAEYRREALEAENAAAGRELFAKQARAVADLLKDLAVRQSVPTGANVQAEQELQGALGSAGIPCDEAFVLGELPEVYITVCGNFPQKRICAAVSRAMGKPFSLATRRNVCADKNVYLLRPSPVFDAAFGVASATKEGESACGDTTSVLRIDERNFLCALADGMGSGQGARSLSDAALGLVESLYRAGMAGDTVLQTVNRLLSFQKGEGFACLDVATVNLDTGRADIIKAGSPLAFLITRAKVETLESDSLPLGILEGVHPTTIARTLSDGDVLVFLSDGISSAFGSGTDVAEFLSRKAASNPQTLADALLSEALARTGTAQDDMTALAVRLFSRVPRAEE